MVVLLLLLLQKPATLFSFLNVQESVGPLSKPTQRAFSAHRPLCQTLRRVAIQTPKITAINLCCFSLQFDQQVNENGYLAISTESVSITFCKLTFCTTTSTAESISATMATFLLPDFGSHMGQGRLHSKSYLKNLILLVFFWGLVR